MEVVLTTFVCIFLVVMSYKFTPYARTRWGKYVNIAELVEADFERHEFRLPNGRVAGANLILICTMFPPRAHRDQDGIDINGPVFTTGKSRYCMAAGPVYMVATPIYAHEIGRPRIEWAVRFPQREAFRYELRKRPTALRQIDSVEEALAAPVVMAGGLDSAPRQ